MKSLFRRQDHNGEVVDRNWLYFSFSQGCLYCFTCRLMCADTTECAHFVLERDSITGCMILNA